ncbi:ATP-binding protein [Skermania piniformis]|uniref:Nuclease SbcCD subunit C n=1 Tax=Skermania pinensis TaxID=39122 RepID=A0ABX8SEG9_9ACTN|nr:ATP-binding protein [Skermania piniformis]QXQ15552.1 AAA family ATPase [Skermania piniformis]
MGRRRLDADAKLSEDSKLLVLAALEGRTALADLVGFARPEPADSGAATEPVGAFLQQISVGGFRGIGPQARLELAPYPSLTVVSGRNGSGKSSFAEALEVALTGTTYRWHNRAGHWKERWRNLHDGAAPRIEVTLAEEGVGHTKLSVDWPDDAELDAMVTSLQRQGEKKQAGTAGLGWAGPLDTYRPLLTYEELGALLAAEPKVLYDKMSKVLGLEQLTSAVRILDDHRKATAATGTELATTKRRLVAELAESADERATRAGELLGARTPDIAALRRLATGTAPDVGVGSRLRALLRLDVPREPDCAAAATELRAAVEQLAETGTRIDDALQRRSRLIDAAIAVHDHDGDQACPVCRCGRLDATRVAELRAELSATNAELSGLDAARARRSTALTAARSLVGPVPEALRADLPDELAPAAAAVLEAWSAWSAVPEDALALAAHLTTRRRPLAEALATLLQSAERFARDLDEAWSTLAARLAGYADRAEAWQAERPAADQAAAAHKWLKANEIVLKNERVRPIAAEAIRIWSRLRQESNVAIADVTLASSNTRRHVLIAAEVDGADAGALAVMSQGELHALALALFLPRATMSQSPFRFVVLDDPVQAMDPAKVDGLVEVLLELARSRQVIVFSHDDRFASAVRRAPKDVPIKILEIVREAGSTVRAVVTDSPASRYLHDAFGLAKDNGLPEETLRRVLPGLLRMALEAQAREAFFTRELTGGAPHRQVEEDWTAATKTRQRLALGLDDPATIENWLNRQRYRKSALNAANAIHSTFRGDPLVACRDVEKTMSDLAEGRR